jgi:hypothetical protein
VLPQATFRGLWIDAYEAIRLNAQFAKEDLELPSAPWPTNSSFAYVKGKHDFETAIQRDPQKSR